MYKFKGEPTMESFIKKSEWSAYVGCILAVLYAVFVRFLEAAGGGIISTCGLMKDPESVYMASYFAGVLIMICGFCLLGLVKPWGKNVPQRVPLISGKSVHPLILLIPSLLGAALLLAHGISGMLTKSLFLAGFITIDFPGWAELNTHRLALWDLFFYEPWFTIMGLLTVLATAHYALASNIQLKVIKRITIWYLLFVLLLIILVVFMIIFDFKVIL